ncbi:MBL fold metallo-hydrolase [Saccharopolyspora sp. NPDC002686]|uniref:MBL fold metallo-hydrolase n=1 Tax=Saccharopolyspora sp. NPDC002686 TaxID=3154541 RepID=UPI00331A123E
MHSTELVLLGTAGGPTPKRNRSAPAQAIVVGDRTYLIDAGNGVARQLVAADIPLRSLTAACVTHHHSDHNVDLGTVVHLAWCADLRQPVRLYGPPPLTEMMAAFARYADTDVTTRIADEGRPDFAELIVPEDVHGPGPVYEDDRVRISATRVHHPPMDALAYRIDTEDRSIVISGDTAPCQQLVDLATGADVLVHEVMHVPSIEPLLARTNGARLRRHLLDSHTSVSEVGAIAESAGVPTLVLSHFVPSDPEVPDDVWREEAQRDYTGKVIVGQDLMSL